MPWGDNVFLSNFATFFNHGKLPLQLHNPSFIRHYCVTQYKPSFNNSSTPSAPPTPLSDTFTLVDAPCDNDDILYISQDQLSSLLPTSLFSEFAPEFNHKEITSKIDQLSGHLAILPDSPTDESKPNLNLINSEHYCFYSALIRPKSVEVDEHEQNHDISRNSLFILGSSHQLENHNKSQHLSVFKSKQGLNISDNSPIKNENQQVAISPAPYLTTSQQISSLTPILLPRITQFSSSPSLSSLSSPALLLSPIFHVPNTLHNRALASSATAQKAKSKHNPLTLRADTRLHSIELLPLNFYTNEDSLTTSQNAPDSTITPNSVNYITENNDNSNHDHATFLSQSITQYVLPMITYHFATAPHIDLVSLSGYLSHIFFIDLTDEQHFTNGLNNLTMFIEHRQKAPQFNIQNKFSLTTAQDKKELSNRTSNVILLLYGASIGASHVKNSFCTIDHPSASLESQSIPLRSETHFSTDSTIAARYAFFDELAQGLFELQHILPLSIQTFPIPIPYSNSPALAQSCQSFQSFPLQSSQKKSQSLIHIGNNNINDDISSTVDLIDQTSNKLQRIVLDLQFRFLLQAMYAEILRYDLKYTRYTTSFLKHKDNCKLM